MSNYRYWPSGSGYAVGRINPFGQWVMDEWYKTKEAAEARVEFLTSRGKQ